MKKLLIICLAIFAFAMTANTVYATDLSCSTALKKVYLGTLTDSNVKQNADMITMLFLPFPKNYALKLLYPNKKYQEFGHMQNLRCSKQTNGSLLFTSSSNANFKATISPQEPTVMNVTRFISNFPLIQHKTHNYTGTLTQRS